MRVAFLPVVVAVSAVVAGCGNLSQEDLLFRAGVPTKQALAVTPPGTEAEVEDALVGDTASRAEQALEERCDDDLLCQTRNIARGFNSLTFGLLDIVDAIAQLPATHREVGRRVWGPHFDDSQGLSFRFEMTRADDGFDFCLHAVRGRMEASDATNALTCADGLDVDDVDSGDLSQVLSGSFAPSSIAGDAARRGQGTMHLEAGRLARFNRETRFANVADFVFDNTDGTTIAIDLLGTTVNGEDRDSTYAFVRSAEGDGQLVFDTFAELVEPQPPLFGTQTAEHVRIDAVWNADRAGAATGLVNEGNATRDYTINECWNADLDIVYDKDIFGAESGAINQCALPPP
jgi:hypothetical protein